MKQNRDTDASKVDMDIMHAVIDKVLAYGPPKKESRNGTGKAKNKQRKARDGEGANHGRER